MYRKTFIFMIAFLQFQISWFLLSHLGCWKVFLPSPFYFVAMAPDGFLQRLAEFFPLSSLRISYLPILPLFVK